MKNKLWQNLCLSLIALVFFLFLMEIGLRIFNFHQRGEAKFFLFNREFDYPEYYLKDNQLFWRLRPSQKIESYFMIEGVYEINSKGLREKEFSEDKNPNTIRIVCLGNSCTFGWKVKQNETYSKRLEEILNQKFVFPKFEVINAGVTGYTTFQGLRFLQSDILKLQPDIIILNYGWNDQMPAAKDIEDKNQKLAPQWLLDLQNFLSKFYCYRFLRFEILKILSPQNKEVKPSKNLRVSLIDFKTNLEKMVEICKENKIKTILMTSPVAPIPVFPNKKSFSPVHLVHQNYNNTIINLCSEKNIPLVDIAKSFENCPSCYYDPQKEFIHYNALGHKLVAEEIFKFLSENFFRLEEKKSL